MTDDEKEMYWFQEIGSVLHDCRYLVTARMREKTPRIPDALNEDGSFHFIGGEDGEGMMAIVLVKPETFVIGITVTPSPGTTFGFCFRPQRDYDAGELELRFNVPIDWFIQIEMNKCDKDCFGCPYRKVWPDDN